MNNNVKIELDFLSKINYSLLNSGKKLIDNIIISNESELDYKDLICKISFVPEFSTPYSFGGWK